MSDVTAERIVELSNPLVEQADGHFEVASRSVGVYVAGVELKVSQNYQTVDYFYNNQEIGDTPDSIDEEGLTDQWFRRHIIRPEGKHTFLEIGPVKCEKFEGAAMLPNRFQVPRFLNSVLYDPFEGEVVKAEREDYDTKWLHISSWMIDQLKDAPDITYVRGWSEMLDTGELALRSNGYSTRMYGFSIIEATDLHVVKSANKRLNPTGVFRQLLIFDRQPENKSLHFLVEAQDKDLKVLDMNYRGKNGQKYPVINTEGKSKIQSRAAALLEVLPDMLRNKTKD